MLDQTNWGSNFLIMLVLEENGIILEKYRKKTTIRPDFIRYDHQMQINGYEVRAIFNEFGNGEIFLNDTWVVTQ